MDRTLSFITNTRYSRQGENSHKQTGPKNVTPSGPSFKSWLSTYPEEMTVLSLDVFAMEVGFFAECHCDICGGVVYGNSSAPDPSVGYGGWQEVTVCRITAASEDGGSPDVLETEAGKSEHIVCGDCLTGLQRLMIERARDIVSALPATNANLQARIKALSGLDEMFELWRV